MKLVASRELARRPLDITYRPGGELAVLSSTEERMFCNAYTADLTPLWSARLDERALALTTAPDGILWVLDGASAVALGENVSRFSISIQS